MEALNSQQVRNALNAKLDYSILKSFRSASHKDKSPSESINSKIIIATPTSNTQKSNSPDRNSPNKGLIYQIRKEEKK